MKSMPPNLAVNRKRRFMILSFASVGAASNVGHPVPCRVPSFRQDIEIIEMKRSILTNATTR